MRLIQPSLVFVGDDDKQLKMEQMWKCARCGLVRQWGFGPSLEPKSSPFLYCKCRKEHTRHTFAGLKETA